MALSSVLLPTPFLREGMNNKQKEASKAFCSSNYAAAARSAPGGALDGHALHDC